MKKFLAGIIAALSLGGVAHSSSMINLPLTDAGLGAPGNSAIVSTSPGAVFAYDSMIGTLTALGVTNQPQGTQVFWIKGISTNNGTLTNTLQNAAVIGSNPNTTFSGTIAAAVLTAGSVVGCIQPGDQIGSIAGATTTVTPGTVASAQLTGSACGLGGTSTWTLTGNAQTISVGEGMKASGNCETTAAAAPGECLSFDNSAPKAQFNLNNATGKTTGTDDIKFSGNGTINTVIPPSVWNQYIVTWDTTSGHYGVALNGVQATGSGGSAAFSNTKLSATSLDLNNPGGFGLGNNDIAGGIGAFMEMSDVLVDNVSVACTGVGTPFSDCTTANTVDPAFVAAVYAAGQPLDYGTNCAGPLGHQPIGCWRFRAGAVSTNEGTGAATSTLLANWSYKAPGGGVSTFPSPYPPSGIPAHQATIRWVAQLQVAAVTGTATMSVATGGQTVVAGDALAILFETGNSAGQPGTGSCPTGGANTWTLAANIADTHEAMNAALCTTVAQTGDTAGPWTVNCNGGAVVCGTRSHAWLLLDIANVTSIDQQGGLLNGPSTTTTPKTAADLSTTAANETVVSFMVNSQAFQTLSFPTGDVGYDRTPLPPNSTTPPQLAVSYKYAVPSGTNPQTTWAAGAADSFAGFTLTVVPN